MATTFAPNCSLLVNNTGGAVQSLPTMVVGGKERTWTERITLASQPAANHIMIARLPYGSVPLAIEVSTDTSLSSSTLAVGDLNNFSRFSAAGTLTGTNASANLINVATKGVNLTTAYDYLGVASTAYEDILVTIGVSDLPSSGTLVFVTRYLDYGV